jgi:ribA/ribD-fused uncharacterized protein
MDIALLQAAAKKIEADGIDGLNSAAQLIGLPSALALLVALLRRHYGSMDTWPADPDIDGRVMADMMREVPAVQRYLSSDCAFFYTYEWDCFDNFSAYAVEWNGRVWPTAEHAYQSAKFEAEHMIERIFNARSAHDAKKIANAPQYAHLIRADWQEVKLGVMEEILRAKFAQHEYVRKKLRDSRGRLLVEDSQRDAYWGRGPNWNGENWLGRLWMKLRDEHFPV